MILKWGKACLLIRKHDHFTPTRTIKRHVRALARNHPEGWTLQGQADTGRSFLGPLGFLLRTVTLQTGKVVAIALMSWRGQIPNQGESFPLPKSRTYEGRRTASKMPAKPAGKAGTAGGASAKSAQILESQMKQLQATPLA